MINDNELLEEALWDRITVLDQLCRSPEIRELMARLAKEHGAYPQTAITIEEE